MFPSPPTTPPNTSFFTCSITSLPPNWSNTISLVHQRLLLGALQAPQWKAALAEIHRVLVPGGWAQIIESDRYYFSPSNAIKNHKELQIRQRLFSETRGLVFDIIDRLPEWLDEAGLVNLKIERRRLPIGSWAGETGALALCNIKKFWGAMKEVVMKEGGLGIVQNEDEFDATINDLLTLCEETPETYMEYLLFVVQKPVV